MYSTRFSAIGIQKLVEASTAALRRDDLARLARTFPLAHLHLDDIIDGHSGKSVRRGRSVVPSRVVEQFGGVVGGWRRRTSGGVRSRVLLALASLACRVLQQTGPARFLAVTRQSERFHLRQWTRFRRLGEVHVRQSDTKPKLKDDNKRHAPTCATRRRRKPISTLASSVLKVAMASTFWTR